MVAYHSKTLCGMLRVAKWAPIALYSAARIASDEQLGSIKTSIYQTKLTFKMLT